MLLMEIGPSFLHHVKLVLVLFRKLLPIVMVLLFIRQLRSCVVAISGSLLELMALF